MKWVLTLPDGSVWSYLDRLYCEGVAMQNGLQAAACVLEAMT